ncbi:MAG: recombinase family protein [Clostridiales Family XIII bacterium]|jgi:DNA invertase Pin-like site-specific DNA recombinase|nr:recombinase family protein [Clostridiales Family XIII bacterium]
MKAAKVNQQQPTCYGYARVSTKDQREDRQLLALTQYGVSEKNIFLDKQSGKDFERPEYKRLLRCLKPGDVLFIKSIDRLGRNYTEIIEQWRVITKEIRASIVVIDMPLLDTRQNELDLTGTLISDIVLQLLSYVAETERAYNRQRQAEGIAIAKAKGTRFGRPPIERPEELSKVIRSWRRNEISARMAAKELGVTHKTFIKWTDEP